MYHNLTLNAIGQCISNKFTYSNRNEIWSVLNMWYFNLAPVSRLAPCSIVGTILMSYPFKTFVVWWCHCAHTCSFHMRLWLLRGKNIRYVVFDFYGNYQLCGMGSEPHPCPTCFTETPFSFEESNTPPFHLNLQVQVKILSVHSEMKYCLKCQRLK